MSKLEREAAHNTQHTILSLNRQEGTLNTKIFKRKKYFALCDAISSSLDPYTLANNIKCLTTKYWIRVNKLK